MAETVRARKKGGDRFVPCPEQMALFPDISGNNLNGLGERTRRRASPIYWQKPGLSPFTPLQDWFAKHNSTNELVNEARRKRQAILDQPISPIATEKVEHSPEDWSIAIKEKALALGADLVGIVKARDEWLFEGRTFDYDWLVMLGVAHDYEAMKTAPEPPAAAEVINQYARAAYVTNELVNHLREQGWDAKAFGGPMAGTLLLIPPAIACGFGELGKHGSVINRQYGSSFRLAAIATNIELVEDRPTEFGADDFCLNCKVCSNACPPEAIFSTKQWVRGEEKWYVDFDKCLPYFNETSGCGVCIAVCPWSRPGVADSLISKLARRRARQEAGEE